MTKATPIPTTIPTAVHIRGLDGRDALVTDAGVGPGNCRQALYRTVHQEKTLIRAPESMLPNGFTVVTIPGYLRMVQAEVCQAEDLTLESYLGEEWLKTLQSAI